MIRLHKDAVSHMAYCVRAKMATAPRPKHTTVVPLVREKLAIIEPLWKGTSYTMIAENYVIACSTIANMKKNGGSLTGHLRVENDGYGSKNCSH